MEGTVRMTTMDRKQAVKNLGPILRLFQAPFVSFCVLVTFGDKKEVVFEVIWRNSIVSSWQRLPFNGGKHRWRRYRYSYADTFERHENEPLYAAESSLWERRCLP
jgi:hypothetical protein